MVSIYKNENASIKIKKFETLFKEKLFSFLLNFDVNELNILFYLEDSITNHNFKEKLDSLITEGNIQIYLLENNQELLGLYFLNKKIITEPYISFIIKKSERNKGYGKLGLFLLIQELSNLYPNIPQYYFKTNKNNIFANLIILGNNASLQWQQGYPNEDTFLTDIKNKVLYGIYQYNELMAYGAYILGKDINYIEIDGKWDIPANEKDLAIHRVAVDGNCHGKKYGVKILKYGIDYAKKLGCISVKVDTHEKNKAMQKCINNSGFVYKGIVKILRDKFDNLRNAYEIVL